MESSFLLVMKADMNYAGTLDLQYRILFSEACIKDIIDDMMQSPYLSKQSHSFYVRHVVFNGLTKKNTDVLTLLESLNPGWKSCNELGISHPDRNMLRGTQIAVLVLLKEVANSYTNHATKSTVFHGPNPYQFDK